MAILFVNSHPPKDERDVLSLDRRIVLSCAWNDSDCTQALVVPEPIIGGLVLEMFGVTGDARGEPQFHLLGLTLLPFVDGIGRDKVVPHKGFGEVLLLVIILVIFIHLLHVLDQEARDGRLAHK
jgi:hypothetical protein